MKKNWSTVVWAGVLLILLTPMVTAQNFQHSENVADLGIRSDVRVEPTSLGLNLRIPLRDYPGRNDLSLSASLLYSSKVWRMQYSGNLPDPVSGQLIHTILAGKYAEHSVSGWTSGLDLPWYEFTGGDQYYDDVGSPIPEPTEFPPNWQFHTHYVRRMLVHMPDGSSHELRASDQIFNGLGLNTGTYYSVDGSRLRYQILQSSAVLYLPNGSRFVYPGNNTVQLIDRNGNTLTFDSTTRQWIDTLGRTISLPPMENNSPGDRVYSLPGVSGSLNYTFRWRNLADARTDPNQPLRYIGDLGGTTPSLFVAAVSSNNVNAFDYIDSGGIFNPVVLAEIVLPNQTSYKFTYNVWGEIDKIVYPTGGYERMNYSEVPALTQMDGGYAQANRGVVNRFVSPSGTGADESQWQYTTNSTTAPDGTVTIRNVHGDAMASPYGFQNARIGLPYEERVLSTTGQMLRRKLTKYAVTGAAPGGHGAATRNARVIKEVELLLDTGASQALAKTTLYGYDNTFEFTVGVDQTSVEEYDYTPVDLILAQTGDIDSMPLGTLIRTTVKGYVTNAEYRDRNILGLLSSTTIYKGAVSDQVIASQSSVSYDETALLSEGSVSSWTDPQTSFRGNVTTASQWLNTTGTYLQSHAQYNQCGSKRTTTNAAGNQTQISYADSFSDGVNRNTFAFPTTTTTAVPDPTGQFGSTAGLVTMTVYDFNTGLVTSTTDANAQTTTYSYGDSLNRVKSIVRPDGGLTTYNYSDVVGNFYVETLTKLDASRNINAIQSFDGVGRPNRSFLYVASGSYSTSDTQYDSLGRVFRVSNSYFSTGLGSAINPSGAWTTNAYDELSRVVSVTTADSAVVKTVYRGDRVLVADQNGSDALRRKRISQVDALGRLRDVWEVTAPDTYTEPVTFPGWSDVTAGYRTSYEYDTLDNLTKVIQGNLPPRIFAYDSVKRLVSATNPENGLVSYQYDNNGNLRVKTNARGVSAHYDYDGLNRVIRRWYNADSSITATIHNSPALPSSVGTTDETKYRYDLQSLPPGAPTNFVPTFAVGRVVALTYGGGSAGDYYSYDAVGRIKIKIQQMGGLNYQIGPVVYNFAGGITSEPYPSGRVVSYTYDDSGRVNGVAGNLGDNSNRTYSTDISYTALGGLSQERFGTATPIYNKLFYNSRGQLAEIREGLTPNNNSWQRGAIINFYSTCWGMCEGPNSTTPMPDNNGNLKSQQVFIPQVDDSTYEQHFDLFSQTYDYDSLNRLTSVQEGSWRQAYGYDRFGNRTIKTNQSETYGGVNNLGFEVEPTTNRLYAPGDLAITDETLRRMQYDAVGNLKVDTYSYNGQNSRVYDAENRMTKANGDTNIYTYDGDGHRVKRNIGGTESWQIYGISGELVAEYAANTSYASPQKEYGYRAGQLLITTEAGTATAPAPSGLGATSASSNVALSWTAASGATNYRVERKGAGGSYQSIGMTSSTSITDSTATNGGAYLYRVCAANGSGSCTSAYSNEVLGARFNFPTDPTLCASADNPPCSGLTSIKHEHINELRTAINAVRSLAALSAAWTGSSVQAGDTIFKNDVQDLRDKLNEALVAMRIQTSDYEDNVLSGAPNGTLIKAVHIRQLRQRATSGVGSSGGSGGPSFQIRWLVTDQLGSPRMVFDQTGSLANVSRHDYLPFGEELLAGMGGRAPTQGYSASDGNRKKWAQLERDNETNLDYAQARYYANTQGRFTSADPYVIFFEMKRATNDEEQDEMLLEYISQPQNWAKYSYGLNNPLTHTDPTGMRPPNKFEKAALDKLEELANQAEAAGQQDLADALREARSQIASAINGLRNGQYSVGVNVAVNAILNVGNPEYSNSASITIRTSSGTVVIGPNSNKCNIFVASTYARGAGLGFIQNGRRGGRGYPLVDGKAPAANWLGDKDDQKRLTNLRPVKDGSLQIGDIVAWRTQRGIGQGHSSIYIGGNVLIYAGGGDGTPRANTLNFVNNAMSGSHEPYTVRRYSGKP